MRIKEIPWYNRPGIRMQRKGAAALSDAELLAIVLGRGNTKENAIDQANRILKEHNFNHLSELSIKELEHKFNTSVKALKITAMFEIFRRTSKLQKQGYNTQIRSAEDVFHYFIDALQDQKREHFYALLLDTKNRIIKEELISLGTLNASLIHPREVFNPAIKASANAIILLHNHPSGEPKPSDEDERITKILSSAGELLGIKILDHVIIGKAGFISLREKGVL